MISVEILESAGPENVKSLWPGIFDVDEVQIWVKDKSSPRGLKVLLTHYSRVILENPNPKCDPKF